MSIHLPIVDTLMLGGENSELCARCKGECCKGTPGASDPSDFFNDEGIFDEYAVLEALESGDWVIAWWEGDPRQGYDEETGQWEPEISLDERIGSVYYPRPQFKNKSEELREGRWPWDGGGCHFLTEGGCRFSFAQRPLGCRTLIPIWDEKEQAYACTHVGGEKQDNRRAALNWIPYQDQLFEIARAVEPNQW